MPVREGPSPSLIPARSRVGTVASKDAELHNLPSARHARRRPGHAPRPWLGRLFAWLVGLGFVAVVLLDLSGETRGSLSAPGGWLIAGGRLAAFTGT
jgi:hypothetical protein